MGQNQWPADFFSNHPCIFIKRGKIRFQCERRFFSQKTVTTGVSSPYDSRPMIHSLISSRAAGAYHHPAANQMVPFGGSTMGFGGGASANPYLSMSMMNPNPMMGGFGAMGGMGSMGGYPQSMMSPWGGAATMPSAAVGAKPAKAKRTPSRAASASSSSSSAAAAMTAGGSLDGDGDEDDSMFASEEASEDVQFGIRCVRGRRMREREREREKPRKTL
jgi:hypothetical protein